MSFHRKTLEKKPAEKTLGPRLRGDDDGKMRKRYFRSGSRPVLYPALRMIS